MSDEIVGNAIAYFIIHQYKNDDGTYGAEVLERLTVAKESEYDDAFDGLEYELEHHLYEDRYAVIKVESKLIKPYCWDYACYEYDEELYFEEIDFDSIING